jgi:nitroimidazol reductase NimA-like FMN-containing flavoprotein (pyridoxamine 5'-phosphate oxidase superfamily)
MGGRERSGGYDEVRDRPYAPGYGIPADREGMLSWGHLDERMAAARNYWVSTTRPDGRPHATPVWGVWVDGTFYFGVGPDSRKARNLAGNANVAVHLESGEDVVILEGRAEKIADLAPDLVERLFAASVAKYGTGSRDVEGSYAVRPRVALAWTEGGPRTFTRWTFDR